MNLTIEDGVAVLTLDRPERLNAYGRAELIELGVMLKRCATDPAVRVVLLRGRGRAFCAGADLGFVQEIREESSEKQRASLALSPGVVETLATLPRPTVAQVHGAAFGGGACLALACDVIVAADDSQLGLVFTDLGLPGGDSCAPWLLSRRVGTRRAWRLLASGARLSGIAAHDLGLFDEVVPAAELAAAAKVAAAELAARPPAAMRTTKEQVLRWERSSLSADRLHELERAETHQAFGGAELAEGLRAHQEKRAPDWPDPIQD